MRESEQDNVGVESAHKTEEAAEGAFRLVQSAHRSHQLKPYRAAERADVKADKANIKALIKRRSIATRNFQVIRTPDGSKNAPLRRNTPPRKPVRVQRTHQSVETTAKAAKKAAEETKKAGAFIVRHKKAFLIIGGIAALLLLITAGVSSCSVLFQGGASGLGASTYPSEDSDMLAAEAAYAGMEADLQYELDNYETLHPGYNEYVFDLDDIEHDPYVLISAITARTATSGR
jgi:hypothetical protein